MTASRVGVAVGVLIGGPMVFGQTATTKRLPGIDFSKYHTYKWVALKGGQHPDATVDAKIRQSIDSRLMTAKLIRSENAADLYVSYQIAIIEGRKLVPASQDPGGRWFESMETRQTTETITSGTLILDMYDSAGRNVWTGRVDKVLDPNATAEEKQASFDKAVQQLFEKFPPK